MELRELLWINRLDGQRSTSRSRPLYSPELLGWGRSTQDLVQTLDDLHSWKVSVGANRAEFRPQHRKRQYVQDHDRVGRV